MAKKCFLSFHYKPDNWRVQQVRNIGSIDEQPLLDANKWEEIKKKGYQRLDRVKFEREGVPRRPRWREDC